MTNRFDKAAAKRATEQADLNASTTTNKQKKSKETEKKGDIYTAPIMFYVKPETRKALTILAAERGTSVADVLRGLIDKELKK